MRYMRDWKENSGQYHEKRGTSPSEDKQWWWGGENRKELLFNRVFDVLVRAIKQ